MNFRPTGLHPISSFATRQGHHAVNEDRVVVRAEAGLYAIADGMGGHRDGAGAATETIGRLTAAVLPDIPLERKIAAAEAGISAANEALYRRGAGLSDALMTGATVVAMLVGYEHVCCLWAGDCRFYLWREARLRQVSIDDVSPNGRLNRAVGAGPSVEVSCRAWSVRPGDVCLLCSDGLPKSVSDAEAAHMLASGERNAEIFADEAVRRGARDDVSVIVIEFPR